MPNPNLDQIFVPLFPPPRDLNDSDRAVLAKLIEIAECRRCNGTAEYDTVVGQHGYEHEEHRTCQHPPLRKYVATVITAELRAKLAPPA